MQGPFHAAEEPGPLLQAARVRKVSFVPPPDAADGAVTSIAYDPDTHPACTIYAGTNAQQVWP